MTALRVSSSDFCQLDSFLILIQSSMLTKVGIKIMFLSIPVPCQNGGTCLDGIGDYTCLCVDGFGGKHCEEDIDECLSRPCQNGATCTQYVDSYTCTCPLGFSGINCQTNDQDCTDSSCMNGGTCIDGINSYSCVCKPGLVIFSYYHDIWLK